MENYDALNVNVLNVAKDEYTKQLNSILAPLILQGMEAIYTDSKDIQNGNDIIYNFQILLKEVPKWNTNMISDECSRINTVCDWLHDLITAVFVTNVKILTSVKIVNKSKQFKLKMPNFEAFVHAVYIESARHFFHNPFQLYEYEKTTKRNKNKKEALKAIQGCIEETIRQMLPVQHILQEYMKDNGYDEDMNMIEKDSIKSASEVMNPDITRNSNTNPEQLKNLIQRDLHKNKNMFEDNETPIPLHKPTEDSLDVADLANNNDHDDNINNDENDENDENDDDYDNIQDRSSKNIMVQPRDTKSKKFVEHHNDLHKHDHQQDHQPQNTPDEFDEEMDDLSDISDN